MSTGKNAMDMTPAEWAVARAALGRRQATPAPPPSAPPARPTDSSSVTEHLQMLAREALIIDPDAIKMADISGVTIGADGRVHGAAEAIEALRHAKPYLFGLASTSSSAPVPVNPSPRRKLCTEMTKEEYAVARAAAVKR
jgi:hypothetical protein